jgi:hypothetical protein
MVDTTQAVQHVVPNSTQQPDHQPIVAVALLPGVTLPPCPALPSCASAVGRVFTSGEPEMSGHVQRYDQQVYLRAAEAQRCQVHSTLFMPIYASPRRDACLAVFEVVLTDADVNFAGMVGWIM